MYTKKCRLSVIVPLIQTGDSFSRLDRIGLCKKYAGETDGIEFILVDSSSDEHISREAEENCIRHGIVYVKGENARNLKSYNLSKARNIGALRSTGEWLYFLDIDIAVYPNHYLDIFGIIDAIEKNEVYEKDKIINNFFWVPVMYPSEDLYFKLEKAGFYKFEIINALIKSRSLLQYSTGTSCLVINKRYFSEMGGYNESYVGWGFEDYDFQYRCLRDRLPFPLPENITSHEGNFQNTKAYRGWRSVYRLLGDICKYHGVWLVHKPHPIDRKYKSAKSQNYNYKMFDNLLKQGRNIEKSPPFLVGDKVALIMDDNPFSNNVSLSSFYKSLYLYDSVKDYDTKSKSIESRVENIINKLGVDLIVFSNPYRDGDRMKIYKWCRDNSFPYLVCERGSLPDSVYFDDTGFLADSEKYKEDNFPKELDSSALKNVKLYIDYIKMHKVALEGQGSGNIKKIINEIKGKNVLFIPFQLEDDTVIKYFIPDGRSYAGFVDICLELPKKMGNDWVILYKNHPLSGKKIYIRDALNVDDYNIYDILSVTDKVFTVNSGVGVLAQLFECDVYNYGDSHYSIPGVSRKTGENLDSVLEDLLYTKVFNRNISFNFINYLIRDFYSFGEFKTRRVKYKNDNYITATTEIRFYVVRTPWGRFSYDRKFISGRDSILFEIFCNESQNDRFIGSCAKTNSYKRKVKKLLLNPRLFVIDFFKNRLRK